MGRDCDELRLRGSSPHGSRIQSPSWRIPDRLEQAFTLRATGRSGRRRMIRVAGKTPSAVLPICSIHESRSWLKLACGRLTMMYAHRNLQQPAVQSAVLPSAQEPLVIAVHRFRIWCGFALIGLVLPFAAFAQSATGVGFAPITIHDPVNDGTMPGYVFYPSTAATGVTRVGSYKLHATRGA